MRSSDLRLRLLAVIGATGLLTATIGACGSDPSPIGTARDDDAADARGDAASEAETAADSGAADTAAQDSAGDERAQSPRRPFLVGSSLRSAASSVRSDWGLPHEDALPSDLDAETARDLARAWLADGLEEHASIAAFARFTMMMLSVGSPPELVVAAQRASIDEVAHARECFALARRYGDAPVGPGELDVHDALGRFTLADLAALTAEEGCVGETLGVALATEQLAQAEDPRVRRVLARIVKDETRHAELAWRFVAWAIAEERRGSAQAHGVATAVVAAAERAIAATRAMILRPDPANVAAWHAHGRLTCSEARDASERALQEVVLPCLHALAHDNFPDHAPQPLLHRHHRLPDEGPGERREVLE